MVEEAEQGCHMCLVGTKVDLVNEQLAQRAEEEEVDALAAKHKRSFETSAKVSGVGIFQRIVEGFQARCRRSTTAGGRASPRAHPQAGRVAADRTR